MADDLFPVKGERHQDYMGRLMQVITESPMRLADRYGPKDQTERVD